MLSEVLAFALPYLMITAAFATTMCAVFNKDSILAVLVTIVGWS